LKSCSFFPYFAFGLFFFWDYLHISKKININFNRYLTFIPTGRVPDIQASDIQASDIQASGLIFPTTGLKVQILSGQWR
jgi:hypothetical protein